MQEYVDEEERTSDESVSDQEADGEFVEQFEVCHLGMDEAEITEMDISSCKENGRTNHQCQDVEIPDGVPLLPVNLTYIRPNNHDFEGACMDTGASTSVCGLLQAKSYAKFTGFKFKLRTSQRAFKFGGARQRSIGAILVRLPVPGSSYME